ncbi:thioesterase superfamily enzyme [Mycobacterium europaeum]|uniref:Acyl-coenzyme A thioesterase THEM4 n=1 Tax=Mycobacterium europaeum TaxID=761804 RepID=A0A0U1D2U9_9MYCO|nr:PaaI family thioesterase [Mycobacterium europaeum]CQD07077.1 thioesterase superfamily enzyme [Mycobacterium europaeum]
MTDPSSTYELLAISVRNLIDATIRTELEPNAIASIATQIDAITGRLSTEQMPGSFGERVSIDGQSPASGNAVIGVRNPLAPPLVIHEGNGAVWSELILGAAYEGPAGYVHGGVCAMVLDHVLGATAHKPGRPAYTGTLTLRYHRGTPLRKALRAEAWVDRVEGVKTFAVGQLSDSGGVTVSAEGVFIHPRK